LIYTKLSRQRDFDDQNRRRIGARKRAKAAIEGELTREAVEVLRKAYRMAGTQAAFSGEGPLRDARHNVGVELPSVTGGQPHQAEINKAKSAIEAWIKALEDSL
jgi:hypothetical protein